MSFLQPFRMDIGTSRLLRRNRHVIGGGTSRNNEDVTPENDSSPEKIVPVDQWKEMVETSTNCTGLTRTQLNHVVMNYLVMEGYKEAAEKFQVEAEVETAQPVGSLLGIENRRQIREAIISGQISDAIRLTEEYYPGFLDSTPIANYELRMQQLIELVREKKLLEALKFAEQYLAPCVIEERKEGSRPEGAITPRIEQCMCLLAFDNPEESMFKDLLSDYHRIEVAELVNCHLLKSYIGLPASNLVSTTPHPMPTALSWLVQAMMYAEDRCGDSVPRLESLDSGRLRLPGQSSSSTIEADKDA